MRKILYLLSYCLLMCIAGCGKQLPATLPPAPQLKEPLLALDWPPVFTGQLGIVNSSVKSVNRVNAMHSINTTQTPNSNPKLEQNNTSPLPLQFQISGALQIRSITLPIHGFVSITNDRTVAIALLSQMGTSILEAKATPTDYSTFTVSPLIEQHPQLETILIRMIRAIYTPSPATNMCIAGVQKETAQLRCNSPETVRTYTISPSQPRVSTSTPSNISSNNKFNIDHILLKSRHNGTTNTTVNFTSWTQQSKLFVDPSNPPCSPLSNVSKALPQKTIQDAPYPATIMYIDNRYPFSATLLQSKVQTPLGTSQK